MARFVVLIVLAALLVSCGDASKWPEPPEGCAFFTESHDLPQTQSPEQLAQYLASEHFDYDLDGWFFMGSLIDSAAPDDIGVFFLAVQRIEMSDSGFRAPVVPAIVGFSNSAIGHYEFRGFFTLDADPLMTVTSDPWNVRLNSPLQSGPLMTISLVSGMMGAVDAKYRITADIPDFDGVRLQVDVQLRDHFGIVNQGYGPASFFPQFLTAMQRAKILSSHTGSVADYLESTGDPMSCQGSYYYSLPLMDVEQFSVKRDDITLSSGTQGLLWMDYVVQTYDERASEVFSEASWEFFAIQLPEEDAAIMVLQVDSATGALPVATLFSNDSDRTLNSARKAVHSWAIDEIKIEAVSGGRTWTSPTTGKKYAMEHHVRLTSPDWEADLTITMVLDNQEIVIDKSGTIKYEGLGIVEGTLQGQPIEGKAFVELQPVGHL